MTCLLFQFNGLK